MQNVAPHLDLFRDGEARPGASALEARVADLRALEERPKVMIQPFQRAALDLHGTGAHVHDDLPALCQRPALIKVGEAISGDAITAHPFLQRCIGQLTLILQRGLQPPPDRPLLRENTIDNLPMRGDGCHGGAPVANGDGWDGPLIRMNHRLIRLVKPIQHISTGGASCKYIIP